jgi:hypothetical protein
MPLRRKQGSRKFRPAGQHRQNVWQNWRRIWKSLKAFPEAIWDAYLRIAWTDRVDYYPRRTEKRKLITNLTRIFCISWEVIIGLNDTFFFF